MDERAFHVIFGLGVAVIVGVGLAAAFVVTFAFVRGRPKRKLRVDGRFPPERLAMLEAVSKSYGGAVVNDPEHYRFPFFRALSDGRPYAVALMPEDAETRDPGARYVVRFEAPLAGRQFIEAWPAGSPIPPLRMSSAVPDVDVGDPAFDAAHVVRTDDAAFARAMLSPEMREMLGKLRAVGNGGRVRFDLFPYKLQLQKEEMLADYGSLFEFTRVALASLAEAKSSLELQAGVQFYDGTPPPPEKPVCPICGAGIATGRADCAKCRTPHHLECWKYFGMCSMFACGERRYSL